MTSYEPPGSSHAGAMRTPRPATVTLAAVLMVLIAALTAASAIVVLALSGTIPQEFRGNAIGSGATPREIDDIATGIQAGLVVSGIVGLGLAVVIGLLAIGVLRGSNGARITTVVALVAAVCCGLGSFLSGVSANVTDLRVRDTDAQTAENLGRALSESVPDWAVALIVGLNCLAVLGCVAVAVLLFLTASNAYFRKAPPAQSSPTS